MEIAVSQSIKFIEELPVVEILPTRVRMVAKSGDEIYIRAFDRSLWRRFIETEWNHLMDHERVERGATVVHFPMVG